ncbi:sec-independent protein translocase protein TatA [Lacinutrix venerupis]|uniref:Sec-independent protein translocase protein TatA n=1 Tax=Lacinutrix venerupis TaxID=1486034 RepID=A0AAC9PXM0_9FLAO|nr:twin-arginine translocase TatA/TatE family subunit [Lacinutrix venerupis]APY01226.1 Sec-independent protein translocase TatA [Lacinutrix venerupis]RLJ67398.1 sec-independent protein translocase protein TatA [Lacinutrix venerupis]
MIQLATFLFIGGQEAILIILAVVMIFGAKNIPEIARGLGKGMRMLKDASNDIKSEITKTAEQQGIDTSITKDVEDELKKVKDDFEDFTGSISRKM